LSKLLAAFLAVGVTILLSNSVPDAERQKKEVSHGILDYCAHVARAYSGDSRRGQNRYFHQWRCRL